jgi:hypothetical protein
MMTEQIMVPSASELTDNVAIQTNTDIALPK